MDQNSTAMQRMTTALRNLLKNGDTVVAPGCYDPLSARLIQGYGFNAVYLGGWATGAHFLCGEPQLTLTEMVTHAEHCVRGLDIPLIVDAGAGYGDPIHVHRAVREFERVGVAAIHIEDEIYPKRMTYHKGLIHIIPLEQMTDKVRSAVEARRDPDFFIIARTDAHRSEGGSLEETIRRVQAFMQAGADAVVMPWLSPEYTEALIKEVPDVTLVCMSGRGAGVPQRSVEELAAMGNKIILYPATVIQAAVAAAKQALSTLKSTHIAPEQPEEISREVYELIGMPAMWELEARTTERHSMSV